MGKYIKLALVGILGFLIVLTFVDPKLAMGLITLISPDATIGIFLTLGLFGLSVISLFFSDTITFGLIAVITAIIALLIWYPDGFIFPINQLKSMF